MDMESECDMSVGAKSLSHPQSTRRNPRFILLSMGIIAAGIVYLRRLVPIIDNELYNLAITDRTRQLRRNGRADGILDRLGVRSSMALAPAMVSQGAGPELINLAGQTFNFNTAPRVGRGLNWYRVVSSPRFKWNVAPYRWNQCPAGSDKFLGDTGFIFNEPSPQDPTKMVSKYLRFQITRRDERDCSFNYSKTCLSGGSFLMTLGKTAKQLMHPGDYSLKTSNDKIRIVAYNTNRDCSILNSRAGGESSTSVLSRNADSKTPMDYIRQDKSSTLNPRGCAAWIEERAAKQDLFQYNSDMSTVHVDTPWMQLVIQVTHHKVEMDEACVHSNMNVWITNISKEITEDGFNGVLGGNNFIQNGRTLEYKDAALLDHVVDGPFGSTYQERSMESM